MTERTRYPTMTNRSVLLPALALLLTLAACTGSGGGMRGDKQGDAFPNHSPEQVRALLGTVPQDLTGLKIQARTTLRSPIQSGSFTATIHHRRDDSLYMSVKVLLGIEPARVLVTPDSFFVYDRIKKEVMYGSLDESEGLLPAPLASEDPFLNLLGLIHPDPTIRWSLRADDQYYYLEAPKNRARYIIDPGFWRVLRYETRDAEGLLTEARTFADFQEVGDLLIPHRVNFQRPQEDVSIQLTYRDVDLNPASLSFDLRARSSARRTPFALPGSSR